MDNISVREVTMPAALSLAVEGDMSYANTTNQPPPAGMWWENSPSDTLRFGVEVDGTPTRPGRFYTRQSFGGVNRYVVSSNTTYSPGLNVPFSWASRYGATFLNGAHEGTVLTETTPAGLPDLTTADLRLATTGVMNLSKFRLWTDDLTDSGLGEATS